MTDIELKETKLFKNLIKVTEQFLLGKNRQPHTLLEIMQKLNLPKEHKKIFHQVLRTLIEKEICSYLKGRYLPKKEPLQTMAGKNFSPKSTKTIKNSQDEILAGIIRMHPRGFGFVSLDPPSSYTQDIFIPKYLTQNAIDGDRVEVKIHANPRSEKGPEGEIIAILERGRTHLAGIITSLSGKEAAYAYAPLLGEEQSIFISQINEPVRVGDRVVLKVTQWGGPKKETQACLSHIIGPISDASKDVEAAIEEFELRKEFPSNVIQEAESFSSRISSKECATREDFRSLECFTIDPTTAKDFDDALTLIKKNGDYHLGVHIADVSHYVTAGSALDIEAKKRCNSTYFPGTCVPMLPPALSENLCSLRANVNRLTASVMMHFDKEGNLLSHRIVKGLIKSQKRFTYHEAKEVLDGKKKSQHKRTLELMVELCNLLKKKRYERGSIEFCIPELRIVIDPCGNPSGTEFIPYDITHQMVEEFMLKANEVVALHLNALGKDLTYRIHDEPSDDSLRDFSTLSNAFGFELPEKPTSRDLQLLFDEALQTPIGPFLATSYIRKMRLAIYSPTNIGHYGLGLTHYCHFTSPIRRYIDLVVHRLLFENPLEYEHLEEVANQCSERERVSEKAERNVLLLKKLRLLKQLSEKQKNKQFEAIVTRVKGFGITFEITDLLIEGFLHVSELQNDYYVYDEKKGRLSGSYTGSTFFAGDKITVMLNEVNLIMLETRWFFIKKELKNINRK